MNIRIAVFGIALASVSALTGSAPALAANQTAKAAMPQVLAAAKKWQGDAMLVHLSTTKAQPDGTAPEWKYSFYSPKTGKRCVVTAHNDGATLKEVRLGNYTEALGEFIDSNKAMDVARKNGLTGSEPSMSVMRPAGARADRTTWIVTGNFKPGDTTVSLDAKTGKLIKRTVIGTDL